MGKISGLPENLNPTLDDYVPQVENTATITERTRWSSVLKMLLGGIYPVGCIYISVNPTNPADVFGFGTWSADSAGRFIVGAGTSDQAFAAGATGGESNHTLSAGEMPTHSHGVNDPGHAHNLVGRNQPANVPTNSGTVAWGDPVDTRGGAVQGSGTGISIQNSGSGSAHNNLPPYKAFYVWRRTA